MHKEGVYSKNSEIYPAQFNKIYKSPKFPETQTLDLRFSTNHTKLDLIYHTRPSRHTRSTRSITQNKPRTTKSIQFTIHNSNSKSKQKNCRPTESKPRSTNRDGDRRRSETLTLQSDRVNGEGRNWDRSVGEETN